MKVIKLGGSLCSSGQLPTCLAQAAGMAGVVLVPGGGAFANQVRMAQHDWRFSDDIAHGMALLAMQQMALLCKGLDGSLVVAGSLGQVKQALAKGCRVIWSPQRDELDGAGVPASWDVSSDSLAAWLAKALSADELVLVKAAAVGAGVKLSQLAEEGIIDPAFCAMVKDAGFKTTVITAAEFCAGIGWSNA